MRIAKPLLIVTTPLGVAGGLHEAFRLAGGLAFIMVALIAVIGAAMTMLVMTIRRERLAEQTDSAGASSRTSAMTRSESSARSE